MSSLLLPAKARHPLVSPDLCTPFISSMPSSLKGLALSHFRRGGRSKEKARVGLHSSCVRISNRSKHTMCASLLPAHPLARGAAVAGGALLGLHLLYRFLFRKNHVDAPNFYDNKSEKWRIMRRRSFPPGCPRGWYQIVSVAEMQKCR